MSDTNTIDEKKIKIKSISTTNLSSNIQKFLIYLAVIILFILLHFSIGGMLLFLCKLAQSNILPTESKCAPYTDAKPDINPSPIQTNIFNTFTTDQEMSMKLEIPYEINSKNTVLDFLKKYKDSTSSGFLVNYFISIAESILQFNYSCINKIMNTMNTTFSESVIIGIGPIINLFLYSIGIIVNHLYFIYLWFSNMSWFFKTNSNTSGEGKPEWHDVSVLSPVSMILAVMLVIGFTILLFVGFPFLSIFSMIFYHNSIFSTLFYKGILNGKKVTAFSIIKDTLLYHKVMLVTIISIILIFLSFYILGVMPGFISVITILLIYSGFISIEMFKPITESNLSPLVSYEQAKKTCGKGLYPHKKHGFLYNMLIGDQNGGGNIAKKIKKLGEILNK
jgi:hypothetical protein